VKSYLLPFTCLLFLALFFGSCMRATQLTVLQPAAFKLPDHIATVAVVDRSKPSNGWLNVLEGIVTGEGIGQDRRSREQAVAGLTEALTRTPRFQVKSTGLEYTGSRAGVRLPEPMPWPEIERICREYGADAVVAIESFDSDNFTSARKVETKRKDKSGKQYLDTHYDSEQRTGVRLGWRLYDPKSRVILDEITTSDEQRRSATGQTERQALGNLPAPVNVSREAAYFAGQDYGARIAPLYVSVSRNFYAKAKGFKPQMQKAARLATGQEWAQAAEIWQNVVDHPNGNRKAAGRAAYNLAVAAEMEGDLDGALQWARKAYNDYGNSSARTYAEEIRRRQRDAERVEEQMKSK
jgi:hypothetical protein